MGNRMPSGAEPKKNPLNEFIFSLKLTAKIGKNVFDLAYKSKTLDLQQYTYITALVIYIYARNYI